MAAQFFASRVKGGYLAVMLAFTVIFDNVVISHSLSLYCWKQIPSAIWRTRLNAALPQCEILSTLSR